MNTREAAFAVIHEVLYKDGYSNIALDETRTKGKFNNLDSAFITALTMGTIRNSILLEHIIMMFSNIKFKKMSPAVASIMKMGAYQILHMDKVPDSAAVNESVKLAGKFAGNKSKGFVNAVLRKITRSRDKISRETQKLEKAGKLDIIYSCSPDAYKELINKFGQDKTQEILKVFNTPARMCVRINSCEDKIQKSGFLEKLGVSYEKGIIAQAAYYINAGHGLIQKYCDSGMIAVQDEGAQAMVEFMQPEPNTHILDACAAPGGKTSYISCLMKGKGYLAACDISKSKIERMKKFLLAKTAGPVDFFTLDMTKPYVEFNNAFDKVLADVPCSGMGSAQRRPEIKLNYKKDGNLLKRQSQILENCAQYVKPKGEFIYGTCTLFDDENRKAVENFLQKDSRYQLIEDKLIIPDGNTGGFYMARMVRQND